MKRRFLAFYVFFLCVFLCISLLLFSLSLGGCVARGREEVPTESEQTDQSGAREEREEALLRLEGRRYFFEGDSEAIEAEEDCLRICQGGIYRVTGTLSEGSLWVSAPADQVVHLILDGVSLSSSFHPPLFLEEAACVILETAEGTVNRLTDRAREKDSSTELSQGCLVSLCDLVLRGSGSLIVSGRQTHALVCYGGLYLSDTSLSLSAPDDGIWVRDCLRMEGGSLTVSSAKRGIVTSDRASPQGLLELRGGRVTLNCSEMGLFAASSLSILDTELSLHAPIPYQAPKINVP